MVIKPTCLALQTGASKHQVLPCTPPWASDRTYRPGEFPGTLGDSGRRNSRHAFKAGHLADLCVESPVVLKSAPIYQALKDSSRGREPKYRRRPRLRQRRRRPCIWRGGAGCSARRRAASRPPAHPALISTPARRSSAGRARPVKSNRPGLSELSAPFRRDRRFLPSQWRVNGSPSGPPPGGGPPARPTSPQAGAPRPGPGRGTTSQQPPTAPEVRMTTRRSSAAVGCRGADPGRRPTAQLDRASCRRLGPVEPVLPRAAAHARAARAARQLPPAGAGGGRRTGESPCLCAQAEPRQSRSVTDWRGKGGTAMGSSLQATFALHPCADITTRMVWEQRSADSAE